MALGITRYFPENLIRDMEEIKGLTLAERRALNKKIQDYNRDRHPLRVFLEIMKLDLTDRPALRESLYKVIEGICSLQKVDPV